MKHLQLERGLLVSTLIIIGFLGFQLTKPGENKISPQKTEITVSEPEKNEADLCEGETQAEMTQCARAYFDKADKKMNEKYSEIIASIQEYENSSAYKENELLNEVDYEETVRIAQRAWVDYRDKECEAASLGWSGGSGQAMIYYSCLERLTNERTVSLSRGEYL